MLHLALVDDGHRLEAAVRMHADAAPLSGRGERRRSGIVQQQKRARMAAMALYENSERTGKPSPTQCWLGALYTPRIFFIAFS